MIQQLVELRNRISQETGTKSHNALKKEFISFVLQIDKNGNFIDLFPIEKKETMAESIQRTRQLRARAFLDKAEYMLGIGKNGRAQNDCFLEKIQKFADIPEAIPVFKFYQNSDNVSKAIQKFDDKLTGNIAFLIFVNDQYVHEAESIYNRIIELYEKDQQEKSKAGNPNCSICGQNKFPIEPIHEKIKRLPPYDKAERALISYNDDAYESYTLSRNQNSSICSNCAKAYVESLNWLIQNGALRSDDKGKEYYAFKNRVKISSDTTLLFWTKKNMIFDEILSLDNPNDAEVRMLLSSAASGNRSYLHIKPDIFYALTLSGASARIAIRNWIETSVHQVHKNLAQWFSDIAIGAHAKTIYPPLYLMAKSCDNPKGSNDTIAGRVATILWQAALNNQSLPLWILSSVLCRIRAEQANISPTRASLIKLVLNRKPENGGYVYMENLDNNNNDAAYVFGRIFAVLESIQWYALGETNAGIRERHFSSASTTPGLAFGRLMNLTQKHLSKLKGDKPGLAIVLDRELQSLCSQIPGRSLPATFRLEEQGAFALGYYHQKNQLHKTEKSEETNNG